MASNAQAAKANQEPLGAPEPWTEEQLEEALEKLKLLHIKSRELRTTVPRMLEPLGTKHASRQDALTSFQTSIASAATELRDFRTLYTSDESKKVFDQAKKSRQAEPKGIKPWRARDHPGWLDSEEKGPQ
ncbi:hypothetical protein JX265_000385 [Neoarthrinium moseri]|uniref:Uncharacterized protein n=1 Tax=Neoarthrinium moseri TaxID=1658444 RepID=A0A9P9WYC0_9PEZI|nr:hypothetical protein JX266_003456 [Neoarthrinium moseri]KAI1881559.1 hypothetical protein JX265_000385 [Neoarthrinium moseri]